MNPAEEPLDEDDELQESIPTETIPDEPFFTSGCLPSIATAGLALLSMLGGIGASCLAIGQLLGHEPMQPTTELNIAAFPVALSFLLRGFACQALVAFALFTWQLHRQIRVMLPGMILVGLVAVLLLLIRATTEG
jgi:hypothetical protein